MTSTLLLIARALLAATFALAGVGKLVDRQGTRAALADFGVPQSLTRVGTTALPLAELTLVAALMITRSGRIAAFASLGLLLVFALAVGRALAQGRSPECHCFGAVHSAPTGIGTMLRIGGLAIPAALVAADGPGRGLSVALRGAGPLIIVVALVILAQAWFSWQLLSRHGRLLERVDTLEHDLAGLRSPGPSQKPAAGLPVGTPAPAFTLPSLDGSLRSLSDLLVPGRVLALAFAEPGCTACAELPATLARAQAQHDGALDVVLVSRGSVEENIAKLGTDRINTVLLQSEREVARSLGVASVPSAILIDPDGRVASPLAVSVPRIERLLGEFRAVGDTPLLAVTTS